MLKTFLKIPFIINERTFPIIKFTTFETFMRLFIIIMNVPSVMETLTIKKLYYINIFFNTKFKTLNLTIKDLIKMIYATTYYGGKPGNALEHIAADKFKLYLDSLICGVKEENAHYYASFRPSITLDLLLTFKALVPVVGSFYAEYFILNSTHNLNDFPYFLEVASKLNSMNYFSIDKCKEFSKTGGDIDKIFTLRKRKR